MYKQSLKCNLNVSLFVLWGWLEMRFPFHFLFVTRRHRDTLKLTHTATHRDTNCILVLLIKILSLDVATQKCCQYLLFTWKLKDFVRKKIYISR